MDMRESGMLAHSVLVFGQMNEPSGARWRTPLAALTLAEYSATSSGATCCCSWTMCSASCRPAPRCRACWRLPSRVGYQPTLASEVAAVQERIACGEHAAITAIEAVYVPADDFTDPAVTAIATHLDSRIVLSRSLAAEGMYPAVDPLASQSRLLDPEVVGAAHCALAREVRETIARLRELQDIIALLGVAELARDQQRVARAPPAALSDPALRRHPGLHRQARPPGAAGRDLARLPRHPRRRGRRTAEAPSTWWAAGTRCCTRPGPHECARLAAWPHADGLHLVLSSLGAVQVDSAGVRSVRAQDASGGFGLWPGHADLLALLGVGVLSWRDAARNGISARAAAC
jgi:hypothetical protein